MVYKKYVKKRGKVFGPYYYQSYREGDKVKKIYIGGEKEYKAYLKQRKKKKSVEQPKKPKKPGKIGRKSSRNSGGNKRFPFWIFFLLFGIGFLFIIGLQFDLESNQMKVSISENALENPLSRISGFVTSEIYNENLEEAYDNEIDLKIKEPIRIGNNVISENKNKRMEFDIQNGQLRLYFDLLNYGEFVESASEVLVKEGIVEENEIIQKIEEVISEKNVEEEIPKNLVKSPRIIGITGMSVENIEKVVKITKKIDIETVQENIDELNDGVLEEIGQDSVIEAENFNIIVNEDKAEEENVDYKWGYEVKLKDTDFMAKIAVTSDKGISLYEDNVLRIGNNLLSFQDLIDEGYNVRFDIPNLMGDVEKVEIVREIVEEESEEELVEETEIEEAEIEEEIVEEEIVGEENEEVPEDLVKNPGIVEEIVEEEEVEEIVEEESENIQEEVGEEVEESEIEEEIVEEEIIEESEIEAEIEEEIVEEEIIEESEIIEEIVEEENDVENVVEGSEQIGYGITGNLIKFFAGITGNAIENAKNSVEIRDLEYSNTLNVYIERDFSNTDYSIGDILYLDPTIRTINISDVTIATSDVNNVRKENNFTHLSISTQKPYKQSGYGLVFYDPFDINHSDNSTYDYTIMDNDGQVYLTGDGKWNITGGIIGPAYELDGIGDFINISYNESLNFSKSGSFTATSWFKLDKSGSDQILVSRSERYLFLHSKNNLSAITQSTRCDSNLNVTTGVWHLGVVTWNSTDISLYLDNETGSTCRETNLKNNNLQLVIGANATYGELFNGTIDEVMVFNGSLNSTQILNIYNNLSKRFKEYGNHTFHTAELNVSSTVEIITIMNDFQNFSKSSINLSLGYYSSSWSYTSTQVYAGNNTFRIAPGSTNISLNFSFYAGNKSKPFYSPTLFSTVNPIQIHLNGIANCTTLSQANTTYLQVGNILDNSLGGDCIKIAAENITFDGNGYWIKSDDAYSGVYSNKKNSTVKNVNITMGTGSGGIGIEFVDGGHNGLIKDNILGSQNIGITLDEGDYNIVDNNFVNVSCSSCKGIHVNKGHYNNITNNSVESATGNAINILRANNNTLINNSATGTGTGGTAIKIQGGSNETILINNTAKSTSKNGIWIQKSVDVLLVDNNGTSGTSNGINIQNSAGINLTKNYGRSTSSFGIQIQGGTYGNYENNIAKSNSKIGIYMFSNSNHNNLTGNIILSNTNMAFKLKSASNNTLIDNNFTGGAFGIKIQTSHHNFFEDCRGVIGSTKDVLINHSTNSYNNTFLNCTFDSEAVSGSGNELIRKWYYRAYTNYSNGTVIGGVRVLAHNVSGDLILNETTATNGYTPILNITEYINLAGTRSDYNNYTINASKSAKSIAHTYNVSFEKNNLKDIFTIVVAAANTVPDNPTVSLNSSNGLNKTLQNLYCFANITDPDKDKMNISVRWYMNNSLNFSLEYNVSAISGRIFNASLNSGNTSKGEVWGCGIKLFDGGILSTNFINSTSSVNVTILNTLPRVALLKPDDGNQTIDRTPNFTWTGNDDDGDSLQYEINITTYYTGGGRRKVCDISRAKATQGSASSFNPTDVLNCLWDNGYYFNWTVRAHDGDGYGNWNETERNISISSNVAISLSIDYINFSTIGMNGEDNTTDNNPKPFVLKNDGNVELNISVNATNPWDSINLPHQSYRYKIRNVSNTCFDYANTSTSWTNIPSSVTQAIQKLNFTVDQSSVCGNSSIDISVSIPNNEPPGNKTSYMTFTASLGEPGYGAD